MVVLLTLLLPLNPSHAFRYLCSRPRPLKCTDNGIAANLTLASPSLQYAEGQMRGYFELTCVPKMFRATKHANITSCFTAAPASALPSAIRCSAFVPHPNSLTPSNATADFYGFKDTHSRNSNVTHLGSFTTQAGANKLSRPLNEGQTPMYGSLGAGKA